MILKLYISGRHFREISIGTVSVSDKVSVDVPRYTIINIVPGHRVSVGVPRYTIINIVPGHRVSVGVPRYTNHTGILVTIHKMSP
jgi:Gpi18-like mannosyltransferase